MSLIEEALVSRLSAVSAVTALVGSRIYPVRAPEGAARPFLVFQRVAATRETAFGADPGLARARMQVTAWADRYATAKAVATAVRQALQRYRGTLLGVEVLDVFVELDQDVPDDEVQLFGVLTDFSVIHREA